MLPDVLLWSELVARTGGRRAAAAAVQAGTYDRVLRGAYVAGGTDVDAVLKARAAQRLLPEHARVADRCLLWLLGVDVLPPGPPVLEVVVPREQVVPRRTGMRARSTALPPEDRALLQPVGLRVLRPARAIVDLLRTLSLVEAVVVADAVVAAGVVDQAQLLDELARHAGLRGVRRAAEALELSDPRAESPPESRLRVALRLAGFRLVPQHVVLDAAGRFVARVDLALPGRRLAVEYDGRVVHGHEAAFVADRRRQNALLAAGWTVLRFTAADLRQGGAPAVAAVRAALAVAA